MKQFLQALIITVLTLAIPTTCMAGEESLQRTPRDTGDVIPVSLIQGHVTHQSGRYILGPGDTLQIQIRDLDKFNQSAEIRPDGYISVHPFGEYHVAGLDVHSFESFLEEKFKYYLLDPSVTISVPKIRPAIVYVLGEVAKPGNHQFVRTGLDKTGQIEDADLTLTNALVAAGGFTQYADLHNIQLVHASTKERKHFDLYAFLTRGEGEDIVLMPGDKVYVPKSQQAMDDETFQLVSNSVYYKDKFPVVILGKVNVQGEVKVDPSNNTLQAAIGLAGGPTRGAKKGAIVLKRRQADSSFTETVHHWTDEPIALKPGDVVVVTSSTFSKAEEVLKVAARLAQIYFLGGLRD